MTAQLVRKLKGNLAIPSCTRDTLPVKSAMIRELLTANREQKGQYRQQYSRRRTHQSLTDSSREPVANMLSFTCVTAQMGSSCAFSRRSLRENSGMNKLQKRFKREVVMYSQNSASSAVQDVAAWAQLWGNALGKRIRMDGEVSE